jgi:hypothetical protein
MPWTAKQRGLFHAEAARHVPGMEKLAEEADHLEAAGEERPPVHHNDDEEKKHEPWQSLSGTK